MNDMIVTESAKMDRLDKQVLGNKDLIRLASLDQRVDQARKKYANANTLRDKVAALVAIIALICTGVNLYKSDPDSKDYNKSLAKAVISFATVLASLEYGFAGSLNKSQEYFRYVKKILLGFV